MKRLYIFDKDGTICQSKSGQKFINSVQDQELIPGVREKINQIKSTGAKIAIASNQGGVAFGFMTYNEAGEIMNDAANLIDADCFVFCPAHPDGTVPGYRYNSENRKPEPGMIFNCMIHFDIKDLADVIFIGDRPEDEEAAMRAGVDFMWANEFFENGQP